MTGLALLAAVLPLDGAPYPPPMTTYPDGPLREALARLAAAVEHRDPARTQELLRELLRHEWLRDYLRGVVWADMGRVFTGEGPPD